MAVDLPHGARPVACAADEARDGAAAMIAPEEYRWPESDPVAPPGRICAGCRFWGRTQRAGGWRMCYHPKPHAIGVGGQRVLTLPGYGCSQWAPVEKGTR